MRNNAGALSANSTYEFNTVPIGGGGYITHMDVHPVTGRMWAGTDVQNCYVRDPGDGGIGWTTVFRKDTLPDDGVNYTGNDKAKTDGFGSFYGKWAPSDDSRLYTQINGFAYTVDITSLGNNGTMLCTRWNLAAKYMKTNNALNRWLGPAFAVHPTNKNICLLGTDNDGCYYTTNAGATVTQITILAGSGLTTSNAQPSEVGRERYLVVSDPGNANYWYIFVQGAGLYRSTAGVAGPYALVTGGPTGATCLFAEPDGTIWMTHDKRITGSGGVSRIARGGSSFTSSTLTGVMASNDPWHVAVDPFNSNNVLIWREQPGAYSTNRGATWNDITGTSSVTLNSPNSEVLWRIAPAPKLAGGCYFDPIVQNRVWWGEGFGVCYSPDYKGQVHLVDYSAGIEEKIHNTYSNNHNTDTTILTAWDTPTCRITSFTNYINRPSAGPVGGQGVQIGSGVDWAIDDPAFWAASVAGGNHCYSEDDGVTWSKFAGAFPYASNGANGVISVGNRDNIIIVPSNDARAFYTKNGGANWSKLKLNGSEDYHTISAYYILGRNMISACKEQAGKHAIVVGMVHKAMMQNTYFDSSWQTKTWAAGAGATMTGLPGNSIRATNSGAASGYIYTETYGLTGGVPHRFGVRVNTDSTAGGIMKIGTTPGASDIASLTVSVGAGLTSMFTPATTGPVYVSLAVNSTTSGHFTNFNFLSNNAFGVSGYNTAYNAPQWNNPNAGLWVTEDGGDTWTQKCQGLIGFPGLQYGGAPGDNRQIYACELQWVPGFTNDLLYSGSADFANIDRFFWSQDDGATWVEPNSAIRSVWHFGFGKNLPGQARPAVYFMGWVSNVFGFYVTHDWFQTFTLISGSGPSIRNIGKFLGTGFNQGVGGSMQIFGRALTGVTGRGSIYTTYRDLATAT
jgi:hypothetical protein